MRGKKKKTNEIINVVELMMNGNKKRLGSLWSSERSAASLAMQSHHILFWSCRHWGSPRSPLLTIRTCHWIPFKKKNLPSFPPPLPFCFFFFCLFFSLLLHLPPASPPPPARFRRFSEDGNSLVANFIYHFPHFFPEDEELTRFWRYSWSGNTPLLPAYFLSFFLFLSFFFFVPQLSLLTPSPWIPFLILRMQMIWEGMGVLRLDSLPPPPSPPPSSSSSSFSPGGAGVVWRAEAR